MSLKINIANITGSNNEINILRPLSNSKSNHKGYQNVIRLFDDFTIEGPNGIHDCLVTEVVIGMRDLFHNSLSYEPYMKSLLQQFMAGLAYLHEQGVTHGGTYTTS